MPELDDDEEFDDVRELVETDLVPGAQSPRDRRAEASYGVHVSELARCEPGETQNGSFGEGGASR